MAWKIDLDDKARKQLLKLSRREAARIVSFLEERIATSDNPRQLGSALQGSRYHHLWRYRVGDYRIICDIQDQRLVVLVIEVGHRSDIYR